jgi:hypothetical protein
MFETSPAYSRVEASAACKNEELEGDKNEELESACMHLLHPLVALSSAKIKIKLNNSIHDAAVFQPFLEDISAISRGQFTMSLGSFTPHSISN